MEIIIGIGAFIILAVMFGLLAASSREDDKDPVTQEIIVKANNGPVIVHAPIVDADTLEVDAEVLEEKL